MDIEFLQSLKYLQNLAADIRSVILCIQDKLMSTVINFYILLPVLETGMWKFWEKQVKNPWSRQQNQSRLVENTVQKYRSFRQLDDQI